MNKFNAKSATLYKQTFDSRKEGERWLYLRDREKRGQIRNLRRQVPFELIPAAPAAKLRELKYIADFVYEEDGKTVVEDVKGYKDGAAYRLFKAKQKVLYFRFGLLVREV